MSGVFQNIDPPPPHRPASVYRPPFGAGGGQTRWVERWWGVNILEHARHCSVLYIRKYFVVGTFNVFIHREAQTLMYSITTVNLRLAMA